MVHRWLRLAEDTALVVKPSNHRADCFCSTADESPRALPATFDRILVLSNALKFRLFQHITIPQQVILYNPPAVCYHPNVSSSESFSTQEVLFGLKNFPARFP